MQYIGALLMLAVAVASAFAAEPVPREDSAATQAGRNDGRRPGAKAPASDDLAACKREARGLRGPARSRFMTECLKDTDEASPKREQR